MGTYRMYQLPTITNIQQNLVFYATFWGISNYIFNPRYGRQVDVRGRRPVGHALYAMWMSTVVALSVTLLRHCCDAILVPGYTKNN